MVIGATSVPVLGNTAFSIYSTNTQIGKPGVLLVGGSRQVPAFGLLGVELHVGLAGPLISVPLTSSVVGSAEVTIPLPANPQLAGASLVGQFLFVEDTSCSSATGLVATAGLDSVLQP